MDSCDMAKHHFDELSSYEEGKQELARFEGVLQFELKDDDSFYVDIKEGNASVAKGKFPGISENIVTFLTDRGTVRDMFYKGLLSPGLADFMFAGKLWIRGAKWGAMMGRKDEKPITAWAGRLLRMRG